MLTAEQIAHELGVDAKSFRRWLRNTERRSPAEHYQRWAFTRPQAITLKKEWRAAHR